MVYVYGVSKRREDLLIIIKAEEILLGLFKDRHDLVTPTLVYHFLAIST